MRLAYTRPDGGLSIVTAAPKEVLERALGEMTDEQYRDHVIARSIPADARDWVELPEDWQPPADRAFRDAWRQDGCGVRVCMETARIIHRDRLRAERAPVLAALDVEQLRAIASDDVSTRDEVEGMKRRLRDIPAHPAIDAAETPEALSALSIDELLA